MLKTGLISLFLFLFNLAKIAMYDFQNFGSSKTAGGEYDNFQNIELAKLCTYGQVSSKFGLQFASLLESDPKVRHPYPPLPKR